MPALFKKTIFPISLGLSAYFVSFLFCLGVIAGYLGAKYFSGERIGARGKVRSLTFHLGKWQIHLHHWLLSYLFIIFIFIFDIYYSFPHFFLGFLGGVTFQGIYNFRDWYKIIRKR